MNILEDIGGKLEENDLIFREGDKEIGGTTLADRVADSFAPSDRDADLFAPSENKEAGNLQELPTAFLLVTNKEPLDSG